MTEPVVCVSCGAILGWLVRVQTDLVMVRSPLAKLVLHAMDRRWSLECPQCGVRWVGLPPGRASRLLVA